MDGPILLTGATGFVGSYVLRELLKSGRDLVVLARATNHMAARHRVEDSLRRANAPNATLADNVNVVTGDLAKPSLGIDTAGLQRLRSCRTLVHAAACVEFERKPNGDPATTNVDGTRRLQNVLRDGRLHHWLQVSTAYVAGDQPGPIREDDQRPRRFRNAYESSKWQAEQFLRRESGSTGFHLSIARPGIVVGDYETGRTSSYQGFYRLLRVFSLMVKKARRRPSPVLDIPLRLDFDPAGARNLVPVDWVARQIVALATMNVTETTVYHLTPSEPTRNDEVVEAVRRFWGCTGLTFDRSVVDGAKNEWERLLYGSLGALGTYWASEPQFDSSNFRAARPDDLCPSLRVAAIERLLDFAVANDWTARRSPNHGPGFPCAWYLRNFLATHAPQSRLRRVTSLTVTVGLKIEGPGGGEWTCDFEGGELRSVTSGTSTDTDVSFVGDSATFGEIVSGCTSARQAFFDRRFDVFGNIEMGLKMAAIFGEFVNEFPCSTPAEAACA